MPLKSFVEKSSTKILIPSYHEIRFIRGLSQVRRGKRFSGANFNLSVPFKGRGFEKQNGSRGIGHSAPTLRDVTRLRGAAPRRASSTIGGSRGSAPSAYAPAADSPFRLHTRLFATRQGCRSNPYQFSEGRLPKITHQSAKTPKIWFEQTPPMCAIYYNTNFISPKNFVWGSSGD